MGISNPYKQCGYFKPEQESLKKKDETKRVSRYFDTFMPKNLFTETTNVDKTDVVTPLEKSANPKRNGRYQHNKTASTC